MDLEDLVGRTYGPHPLRVCVENVADFLKATTGDLERWETAAPPGFISAALFVVAPDLLGQLTDRSVIHGEQTFAWYQPLMIESELRISGSVSRVRERGGVAFVSFELDVTSHGDRVATGSSLFLVSGDSTAAALEERPEPVPDDRGDPRPGQKSMSRADLVAYAAATRDWNPIHWDHASAVAAGLPGVVVHGLAQAAWALAAASSLRVGDHPLLSARIRFRNPLLPATPVTIVTEESAGFVDVSVTDEDTEYLSARVELGE